MDKKTIELINNSDPIKFINEYSQFQKQHHIEAVKKNPNKKIYYQGWINRISKKADYISDGGFVNENDQRRLQNLNNVDSRLANIIERVSKRHDVIITEGIRTKERQVKLYNQGFTKTKNGNHLHGKAVDIYPADVVRNNRMENPTKEDIKKWEAFAKDVKQEAKKEGLNVQWGGDWKDA